MKSSSDASLELFPESVGQTEEDLLRSCLKFHPDRLESLLRTRGHTHIAGVDEAGRGPLAGPVVACACILPFRARLPKLNDSKLISEKTLMDLYTILTNHPSIQYAVGVVDHDTIDRINILQATFQAMSRALARLIMKPEVILVDGPFVPSGLETVSYPVINGDRHCRCISASSVIAKVTRDHIMRQYDAQWPEYGFAAHKGYGTALHLERLLAHGPCPIHRRSFGPVARLISPRRESLFS